MIGKLRPPPPLEETDALFLDIDGTLVEHQPHPEGVLVDQELRDLLVADKTMLGGAIALITGRSLKTVDRLFAPLAFAAAGIYGVEHRLRPGDRAELADEPEDMRAVAEALQEEFRDTDGLYFERKGPVLAIHTRAAPDAFDAVKLASESALSRLKAGYRIVAGNAGLEFLPVEALKSAAIRRFVEIEPFAGRRPVFIGDDASDESGFEYINDVGGVSIRVGPNNETGALYGLSNVGEVRAWVSNLLV